MADLYKRLMEYCTSDYYPFHMPGHKRAVQQEGNPYVYDITAIEGFDNLHEPQGILRIAMEEAAKFYQSDKTYFLINGSTGGILSAISAVTGMGDEIIIARNCHKSVYHAVFLRELKQVYLYPEYVKEYGICGGIRPEQVRETLQEHPNAKAVVITSPTYEGVVSDIKAIADIVHQYGIPLIVDEAHGAHFGMHDRLPESALKLGADLVIQSLHKTLPALTQTALLHIRFRQEQGKYLVSREAVEQYLSIYQTSSPSYVLMASIDECINRVKSEGIMWFEPYVKRLEVIKQHAKQLTHLKIMDREVVGDNGIFDLDISKLVISSRGTGLSGQQLYDKLNNKFHLQLEMAAGDYAIAMTSPMDSEEGLLRLFTALAEVDRDLRIGGEEYEYRLPLARAETVTEAVEKEFSIPDTVVLTSISAAMKQDSEMIKFHNTAGRISGSYVWLYPPGVPVIAPGDMISGEMIALIDKYRASGLKVYGLSEDRDMKIKVIKENFKRIKLWNARL